MLAVRTVPETSYPGQDESFAPHEPHPERPFPQLASRPNPVYEGVRTLLRDAGLDRGRFGTAAWNPLREWIRPGSRVFVLCNFVHQRRPNESAAGQQAKCIHGSVLRALVDYVLLATGPEGLVRFGNAPLQGCSWSRVLDDTGAARMLAFYREAGAPVEARDLRLVVAERDVLGRVQSQEARDTAAAVEIDLGADSLLAELRGTAPFRVADYDPRRTEAFHAGSSHRYVIHREVLDADVVISLSKLKTHEKVGITCGLKGFVGAVGHKDCLAHHRLGDGRTGGDEYPGGGRLLEPLSRFQDWLAMRPHGAPFQGGLQILDRTARRALRRAGVIQGGAWAGNDTCWRMALDLARIVHFADRDGRMQEKPQRIHLSLIDGVVAGEGEGPLAPTPAPAGVLVFGDDVAAADRVASRLMGYDPARIPLIARASAPMRWSIARARPEEDRVMLDGRDTVAAELTPVLGRPFRPPAGWRERLVGSG